MGRVRKATERLECAMCGATGHDPCLHLVTGKPIKGFHVSRWRQGKHRVLQKDMWNLTRVAHAEEFGMWVHLWFGLRECDYPKDSGVTPQMWKDLYAKYPELEDGYHGEF